MKYRTLGKTGLKVSAIAMGCWAIAGDANWGEQDERDSIDTIHAAIDAGIDFFDTAEAYGDGYSEILLGKVLKGRREEVVIATKVSRQNLAAEDVEKACERSLKRLQTDYIDLYQIHYPSREIPLEESWAALEKLRAQGKIRHLGVSNFGVKDLDSLLLLDHCETNQLPYSLLWRAIEYAIKDKCIQKGIGILCYSPLAQGLLTGKFDSPEAVSEGRARTRHFSKSRPHTRHSEDGCETETFEAISEIRNICDELGQPMSVVALSWLLAQEGVTAVLAGARRPHQIEENVKAASTDLLPDVLSSLSAATAQVKEKLGSNPDVYQTDSRIQ
jgi:aryl-alcohol dehydrogenase-like predicted oxidoreductase